MRGTLYCSILFCPRSWRYFATLKLGIDGIYHHVGRKHLNRYLAEFDFRYNSREVSDVERRDLAIKRVGGKRLKYRDSCRQAQA